MRKSRLLRYIPTHLNVCHYDVFVFVASADIIGNKIHFNKYFSAFGLCLHTLCPVIMNQNNAEQDTAYPFQSSIIEMLMLSLYKFT